MAVLAVTGWFSRRSLCLAFVIASSLLVAACGSTTVTTTGPTIVKCALTLTAQNSVISPAGGSQQVVLTTTPECAWTASADASWVSRIEPSSGQGSGTLRVDVAPNPLSSMRQATLAVNDARAQLQQGGAVCEFAVSGSGSQTVSAAAGSFQVTVAAASGCTWSVTNPVTWLRVTSGSPGTGSGTVEVSVDANAGDARSAELTIAGQRFMVLQAGVNAPVPPTPPTPPAPPGCTFALNPPTVAVPAAGGGGPSLSLTTTCAWTATTNVPWITLTSPTGSGSASLGFTVASNNGAARSGTISVGSATTTINQASGCSVNLNPTVVDAAVAGVTGSVAVSSAASCSWSALSGASWITITSGATGSGNGTVGYSVAANTGGARSGTISVGSATTTINQAACTYSLNPTTASAAVSASTGSVTVSTAASCAWTAVSSVPWVTITSGGTGPGNRTLGYSVAGNTGGARSGTITVGSATTTINQAACSYNVSPTIFIRNSDADDLTVTVTTSTTCLWTAASNVPWGVLTSGGPGAGNGSVVFKISTNLGGLRTGTFTVAGQTVSVTQAAARPD